ncbi:MAG: hypothetical protein PWP23_165 [Candidatus Sumerlaeota bacterium]|nr:hypothetical protein [Candidatus Sumerlaeota bacterium]
MNRTIKRPWKETLWRKRPRRLGRGTLLEHVLLAAFTIAFLPVALLTILAMRLVVFLLEARARRSNPL